MEKNLIHSNELHFIDKKRIHRAVEQLVESLNWQQVPQRDLICMQ